jgi:hypothetical protein
MAKRSASRKTGAKATGRTVRKKRNAKRTVTKARHAASRTGRKARPAARPRKKARRARAAAPAAAIDLRAKGLPALEPPRDNDPQKLDPAFRSRLEAALQVLRDVGSPFRFVEGFRTVERQQWLFGSGRPTAQPFGRPGAIVTHRDGVAKLSNHQGTGIAGTGKGADCYPVTPEGKVFIPPANDRLWGAYADAVKAQGLQAGLDFASFTDAPHCELVN